MALIQTCQIQVSMTVPERLSFPAQLSNCNLATCWHIELRILGLLHLSISIHFSNSFIYIVVLWNSFLGWPWANLALLAQWLKNTDVYNGLLPWESFPGQTWSLCDGNEHHGIDPNMSNSGRLSLHSCQTAILPNVGTLNSAYWAFSTFQSAFISAIALL